MMLHLGVFAHFRTTDQIKPPRSPEKKAKPQHYMQLPCSLIAKTLEIANFLGKTLLQHYLEYCYSLKMILKDRWNLQDVLKALLATNKVSPINSPLTQRFQQHRDFTYC